MSTTRNSIKLSFFTILSRILGLIRDRFQAVFFGTGAIATAWEIAFMLPNMLRNLLAEGVLSQAFIPVYSDSIKDPERNERRVAGVVLTFLSLILTGIVIIGILLFPIVLPLMTDQSVEEAALVIRLSRIMFVFIMTASLTAILAGIANTHHHFSMPAISPIILNLVFILGFLWIGRQNWDSETNAFYLAWTVVLGGVIQFTIQFIYIIYCGWYPVPSFQFNHPALKKIFSLMAPAVLGASLFQLNQLADITIASYFIPEEMGAVPALRFAHRLIQLPTGVIGVALSTAILPALARIIRDGEARDSLEFGSALRFALFLTVPAAIGLYLLGPQIIDLIYFGGEWDERSSAVTWQALQFYSLGIPVFSLNKILTSSYYAYQDTRTPVRIMIVTLVLNFGMNLMLVHSLAQGGIALSTSLSSLVNCVLLYSGLRKKELNTALRPLLRFLVMMIPAWLALGATVLLVVLFKSTIGDYAVMLGSYLQLNESRNLQAAGPVVVGVVLGGGLYLSIAAFMRLEELNVILHYIPFRRKRRR
ncbi:MAG: murein biosynthesis integral membrane protein MurJ [Leptospiraceae bacterium]|nr:murein biosynthesis integral membrane protein MurJ [Leptospiraceae bacterium]